MRGEIANGIGWLLIAIAVPVLATGMLNINARLCFVGAAIAIVGIIVRLARL
jgi:hypothetical protein